MSADGGLAVCFHRTRYAVLVISLLCLTFSFSNHLVFSFTVICMQDLLDTPHNDTHWLQSSKELSLVFSSVALGCLLATLPVSHFVQIFGIRHTCAFYGLTSSLATLLFPLAVHLGYPFVIIVRVLQGVSVALSYPLLGQISSQWSPLKGLGTFVAILSCHMQLCSIITMPLSSLFCNSAFGWRGSFYLHGLVSAVCFLAFLFFYRDDPHKHPRVSKIELEQISLDKVPPVADKSVPYGAILRDPCVWSIWAALIGSTWGIQFFLMFGPIYMNKVLHLDIKATGTGTALPFILAGIVKLIIGPISDSGPLSPRVRLILFTIISQWGMAACLVVMALTASPLVAQISYTAAIVFCGVICVGAIRGASMVYRNHVHFVMAVGSLILVACLFVLPLSVALLCPNNTPEEWCHMLLGSAVFVTLCSTPYIFFARDKLTLS